MFKRLMLIPVFVVGCINATLSDTISKQTEVQIANPYPQYTAGISVPPTTISQSEPLDFSNTLSQIDKIGTLSLTIDDDSVHSNTGDFSFVDELKLDLAPDSSNTSGLSPITIIDIQLTPEQKASADISLPSLVDGNTLLQYFSSGPLTATFTFVVSGTIPTQGLDVVDNLTMDVSANVNKSVNDIGN